MTPVFILSLPRSGSTLLQKIIATHPAVATASEPWLLLPLVGMLHNEQFSTYSEYSSRLARQAISEFVAGMPGGQVGFERDLRCFVESLYGRYGRDGQRYFLDKTPRYYLIAEHLGRIFPDARFVFLYRNPLSVLASIVEKWSAGKLRYHVEYSDLHRGPAMLTRARKSLASRAIAVRYEQLVSDPTGVLGEIGRFLELDYDDRALESYRDVDLHGSMGDQGGVREYAGVSTEPLNKWRQILATPVRKLAAERWLRELGDEVAEEFGYDRRVTTQELRGLPNRWHSIAPDLLWLAFSGVARRVSPKVILGQLRGHIDGSPPGWLD